MESETRDCGLMRREDEAARAERAGGAGVALGSEVEDEDEDEGDKY